MRASPEFSKGQNRTFSREDPRVPHSALPTLQTLAQLANPQVRAVRVDDLHDVERDLDTADATLRNQLIRDRVDIANQLELGDGAAHRGRLYTRFDYGN